MILDKAAALERVEDWYLRAITSSVPENVLKYFAAQIMQAQDEAIEACIQLLPGGTHCDPQEIADMLRAMQAGRQGEP